MTTMQLLTRVVAVVVVVADTVVAAAAAAAAAAVVSAREDLVSESQQGGSYVARHIHLIPDSLGLALCWRVLLGGFWGVSCGRSLWRMLLDPLLVRVAMIGTTTT